MPTTEIRIEGIRNDDDLRLLMNAVQDLPCISDSRLDMSTGVLVVEHTRMLGAEEIRAAVEEAGFTAC